MGGLGSGGWGKKKKKHRRTVESCWVLDVKDLSARGCLQPGLFSTCRWLDGNGGIFSISLRCEAGRNLYLSWRSHIAGEGGAGEGGAGEGGAGDGEQGGEQGDVTEIIPIVYAPCRFGGSRPYFLCPGNNAAGCGAAGCGRRVSKLFLARRYFLCRSCSQVVYAAKYGPQWQRASRQAAKLRQRLDTTGIAVPKKPERMPVHTYARLLEKLLLADTQASEASTARLLRLVAWVEKRRRRNIRFTL